MFYYNWLLKYLEKCEHYSDDTLFLYTSVISTDFLIHHSLLTTWSLSSAAWFVSANFVKGFDGVMERLSEFFVVLVPNRNH